jgi:uncharacterized protein (TIGR02996 family)
MSDAQALFNAIIANPAEDTPRLAYADWLDENGDPDRARFIRLQYEIEKLPPIGLKASKAKKEAEELLKKHEKKWVGEIAGIVNFWIFRRGFVEEIQVTAADFLKHGGKLFDLAPIREIHFDKIGDQMPALVASPHFGRAETLGFNSYIMDQLHYDGRLEALLASPNLATVRGLNLRMSSLDVKDVERITRCPHLGQLRHLDLSVNQITTAGIALVANSEWLPSLTSLTINSNGQVNADSMRVIVDSPLAERLEHLELNFHFHHFGDEPVRILASASRLKKLHTLALSDNNITDAGAKALAEAKNLQALQRLILRGHRKTLGKDGRELLKKRFGKDVCVF